MMNNWEVRLNAEEAMMAAMVGVRRETKNTYSRFVDLSPPQLVDRNGWSQMVMGACAECAVAKKFGIYWSGVLHSAIDAKTTADVGLDIEVRYSKEGKFFLKERDNRQRRMVFVSGDLPTFCLLGWIKISDCLRPNDGKKYYELSSTQILPMSEFSVMQCKEHI